MEKQIALILACVNTSNDDEDNFDDDEDDEDGVDDQNISSQGSGQNSGEEQNHPDGSIFVPNLGEDGGSNAEGKSSKSAS